MTKYKYECNFCLRKFVREGAFIKHHCKQMIRDEEFRTNIGQSAWVHYQSWMRAHHRIVPAPSAFLHSKYFLAFIRFAKLVKRTGLPEPQRFIWLMKENQIPPTMWADDAVYSMYLEFIDRRGDPLQQANITINTLFDVADAAECDVSAVFDILTPNDVIQLLRTRRMSPWFLLLSSKFMKFYVDGVKSEEKIIMETIIRPTYWIEKFKKNTNKVAKIKEFVQELNL